MVQPPVFSPLPPQVAKEHTAHIVPVPNPELNLPVARGIEEVVIMDAIYPGQPCQQSQFSSPEPPDPMPVIPTSSTPSAPVAPLSDLVELQNRISSTNVVTGSPTLKLSLFPGVQSSSATSSAEGQSGVVQQVFSEKQGRGLGTSQKSLIPTEAGAFVGEDIIERKPPTPSPSFLDNQINISKDSNSCLDDAKQERPSHKAAFSQRHLDQLKERLMEAKKDQDQVIRQLKEEKMHMFSNKKRLQAKLRRVVNQRDRVHSKAESLQMENQRILSLYANHAREDLRPNAAAHERSLSPPRRQIPPRLQGSKPTSAVEASDEDDAPSRGTPLTINSAVTTSRAIDQPPGLRKRGTNANYHTTVASEASEPSTYSDEGTGKGNGEQTRGNPLQIDNTRTTTECLRITDVLAMGFSFPKGAFDN